MHRAVGVPPEHPGPPQGHHQGRTAGRERGAPPQGTEPGPAAARRPGPAASGGNPSGTGENSTGAFLLPPPRPVPPPAPAAPPAPARPPGHPAAGAAPVPPAPPPGPTAVLLIGPAGAGKTTVARYWAERRPHQTAHISLDDVREWVRSGFADPQSGWNDNSEAQYRLARRTCGFAARNFLANGISCIIDDAVFPDRPAVGLGGWQRHVGPGLLPVVLLPGLEIVLARNAERSGNRRLSDEQVAAIHGRMAGWYGSGLPIIDNTELDVPATAQRLDRVVAQAAQAPPRAF